MKTYHNQAPQNCPSCGTLLDQQADSPAVGLCPRCLLADSLHSTIAGHRSASPPPSLEDVAAAFPDLEVVELIGKGGMGAVYKARQKSLDRFVALKLLPQSLAADPGFAARFQAEAKALATLNHPNIVTVHDFGKQGDFYFLLMEFIDGPNLRHLIQDHKLTPAEALAIVPPLCDALEFAHKRNIVHRDIKPENLLIDTHGRVKVADFGIARILGQTEPEMESGQLAGTPAYMAPEQMDSPHAVDARADIYSLGVVIYEMLTGERPTAPLTPPSGKNAALDIRLDQVVLRALAANPDLRWQSANALNTELQSVLTKALGEPKVTPPAKLPHSSPKLAWLSCGLALMAILLGVGAYFVYEYRAQASEPERQAAIQRELQERIEFVELTGQRRALDSKPNLTPAEEIQKAELSEKIRERFFTKSNQEVNDDVQHFITLQGLKKQQRSHTYIAGTANIFCWILAACGILLGLRHLSWLRGQKEPLPGLKPAAIGALIAPLFVATGIILHLINSFNNLRSVSLWTNTLALIFALLVSDWIVRRMLAWSKNHLRVPSISIIQIIPIALIGFSLASVLTPAQNSFRAAWYSTSHEMDRAQEVFSSQLSEMRNDGKLRDPESLEEAKRLITEHANKMREHDSLERFGLGIKMPEAEELGYSAIGFFLPLCAAFLMIRRSRKPSTTRLS